jgi:hypothetical protein
VNADRQDVCTQFFASATARLAQHEMLQVLRTTLQTWGYSTHERPATPLAMDGVMARSVWSLGLSDPANPAPSPELTIAQVFSLMAVGPRAGSLRVVLELRMQAGDSLEEGPLHWVELVQTPPVKPWFEQPDALAAVLQGVSHSGLLEPSASLHEAVRAFVEQMQP